MTVQLAAAELTGTVSIAIDGVDGVAVGTFSIPIDVISAGTYDTHGEPAKMVATGIAEESVRASLVDAFTAALDLAVSNIPNVDVSVDGPEG